MAEPTNWSVVGRLLEEVSWEGRSVRKYRRGGQGLENVLTAEALLLLDYLPREVFLHDVFSLAHGADAARGRVTAQVDALELVMLPDELHLPPNRIVIQPDAVAETADVYVLIEAKRIRSSSFQVEQLAREYLAMMREAAGRTPLLLLILGADPPVTVKGLGRMGVRDAIVSQLAAVLSRVDEVDESFDVLCEQIDDRVAWTTWRAIGDIARERAADFVGGGAERTVHRMAMALARTIEWHG